MTALLTAAGCAAHRFEGAAAFRISANAPGATVYIDDTYAGHVEDWDLNGRFVKPGQHRIELRQPDFYTHYEIVKLAPGDAVWLKPHLRPQDQVPNPSLNKSEFLVEP